MLCAVLSNMSGSGGDRCKQLSAGDSATVSKVVTPGDVEAFSSLTGDVNPVHFGRDAIVPGALLNGLVSGVMGARLPGPGTKVVAQTLNFPNACPVGDQVCVTVTVTSVRKIVVCSFSCVTSRNQKTVLRGEAKLIVNREKT
ncbi:hydroxyacyl-thioester dehydratase type 2, mitochondrial-like isoform X2 [Bacillus rossius redtenbacheri]